MFATAVAAPVTAAFTAFRTLRTVAVLAMLAMFALVRRTAFAALAGGWLLAAAAHFLVPLLHRGATGKLDAALLVHAQALDQDLVAHLDDVLDLLDAEV